MCAPLFLGLGVWGGEEGDDGAPLPWSRCLLNQIWGVVDLGFWGSSLMAWRRSRGGGGLVVPPLLQRGKAEAGEEI
jgi:hypothetical protein